MSSIPGEIAVRPSERMLIAALDELDVSVARRVLCTSLGRGQLAAAAAMRFPESRVVCHFLDIYLAEQAQVYQSSGSENLSLICQTDFPPDEIDLAMLPLTAAGQAELTREWLQQAYPGPGPRRPAPGCDRQSTRHLAGPTTAEALRPRRAEGRRPGGALPGGQKPAAEEAQELLLRICLPRPGPIDPRGEPAGRLRPPARRPRRQGPLGSDGACAGPTGLRHGLRQRRRRLGRGDADRGRERVRGSTRILVPSSVRSKGPR